MQLVTCVWEGRARLGVLRDEAVLLPPLDADFPQTMLDLTGSDAVQTLPRLAAQLESAATVRLPCAQARLLAPIPRPAKNIICLGLNYAEHARESYAARGRTGHAPEHPVVFTKAVTTVNGPYADIPYPAGVTEALDWEVELGVVMGSGGRSIEAAQALRHVFGYTVLNDISARDLQTRHKQFFLGKSLDGSCPMGPCIVTADEIPDPQHLTLRCRVNGVLKQHANTCDQIFSVAQVIAVLSRGMTLEAGDIIATGTPGGVGFARQPPEFLHPGDVVECEIERIGCLRNRIVRAT